MIVLSDAANPASDADWHSLKQRRLDLIRKTYDGALTEAEAELKALRQSVKRETPFGTTIWQLSTFR